MDRKMGGKHQGKYISQNTVQRLKPEHRSVPEEKTLQRKSQNRMMLPSKEQIQKERVKLKQKKAFGQALSSTVSVLLVVAAIAVLIVTRFCRSPAAVWSRHFMAAISLFW